MAGVDLSSLPSVDKLLNEPRLGELLGRHSRSAITELVRQVIQEARDAAISAASTTPSIEQLIERVIRHAEGRFEDWPRRVVNATGVILHTNLGRAPLSRPAIEAASAAAAGYSDLEFDLGTGRRGSRNRRISQLIAEATGAEAGLVVNNNASGVMLVLAATAGDGREVIVSRGEAVEIGGGFRVPDVMRQSGAVLVEVGTTNKTYVSDYVEAISDRTAAILRVHPSNFTVSGFTHVPSMAELVEAAGEKGIPVLNDLGSGSLVDTTRFGLGHEPLVQESLDAGVALTMFSGDKLLGGPQAGIIAGRSDLVERVSGHPLARALRTDKVTLAALAATFGSYIRGVAVQEIPVWQMISSPVDELRARATAWKESIGAGTIENSESAVGGGALPGRVLPTCVLAIDPPGGATAVAARLRNAEPPVVGRIENDRLLLDPRTVSPDEDALVVSALTHALAQGN